jgi:outer membrane protein
MKNSIVIIALLCFSAFLPSVSKAQQVAHINYMDVVQMMPEYAKASAAYEIYKQSQEDVLAELQMRYEGYQKSLEKESSAPVPNQTRIKIISQKMQITLEEYQQKQVEIQDSLNAKMYELVDPIKKRVADVVAEVAKEKGYTHVIDNSSGTLIYADPAHDITEIVKAKLGIKDKPTSNSAAGKPKPIGTGGIGGK